MQDSAQTTVSRLFEDHDLPKILNKQDTTGEENIVDIEKLRLKNGMTKALRAVAMEIEGDYYSVTSKSELKKYVLAKLENELDSHRSVLSRYTRKLLRSYIPEMVFLLVFGVAIYVSLSYQLW